MTQSEQKNRFRVMTLKIHDSNDSLQMTMGRIISSGREHYSAEYYDIETEPAAVLFVLIDAMKIDSE